jgi:DNA-binding CsgD family transcriptional regulator
VKHSSVNSDLQRLTSGLVTRQPVHETKPINPVRVPRAIGHPLVVSGVPLVGTVRDVFGQGSAILTVVDPDSGRSRSELLIQRALGLTQAEAATATAIASGLDLAETASRRGVGLETVRSQVKSVSLKTGANTRGAQVALFNRILAAMLDNRSD